jgi:Tfp pilus assembly protein PilF
VESTAFIGMKEPVEIIPYENWDASSFKAAYAVNSLVSGAGLGDLISGVPDWPEASDLGLSGELFKTYTEYGKDEKIRLLAEEITGGYDSYISKVIAVYNYLKNGDYRYSLKPGIAPDGDQLGWFLFQSKKGYCSYYAFAMTLLLRSLGIPARLAAGFFVDPKTNTFDYYPVRSDMAHAWVEVPFPEYGWIEFDPTTLKLADDEDFRFSSGVDPALFEKLMREILENRFDMKAKQGEGADESAYVYGGNSIFQNAYILLRKNRLAVSVFILVFLSLYIRCGLYLSVFLTRNPAKKSIRLMRHAFRRLHLAGLRRGPGLSEPECASQIDGSYSGIYALYQSAAAARFASEYSKQEFDLQLANYQNFCVSYRANVVLWRRIAAWVFPLSLISRERLLVVVLFIGMIAGSQTNAQNSEDETKSANALYWEASDAEDSELWERAIQLYKEGIKTFPEDARFPWALGNLYFDQSLYSLAWDEYRRTDSLIPDSVTVLVRLAITAGYMNRDTESVKFYERALEINPDKMDVIGNLGWMYFKTHRLEDGERLLVSAVERFGSDSHISMTLGTIYSAMYRYDDSKHWYDKSIEWGNEYGTGEYTAIAWYNLSILESRFYHFDLCMEATDSSLRKSNRTSGHLALGEIFKHQLKLMETQKEYETAYGTDTSPLSKLSLAEIYQMSGRLEEARLYAQDCLKDSNNSWMLHFGIDSDSYKKDIHKALAKTYDGLLNTERFIPWVTPKEKILSLFRTVSYLLKREVNRKLRRKYSLAAANAYGITFSSATDGDDLNGASLDSLTQYYNAFRDYPRRAFTYLNKARSFETALIPAAIPSYDYEEGVLFNRKNLIEKAGYGFDPFWEKAYIADCHRALKNAEELFAMNRGALHQAGMKLPVYLDLFFAETSVSEIEKTDNHLERALLRAGFKKENITARFKLTVRIHGERETGFTALCELVDTRGEAETLRYSFPLREKTKAGYYQLARSLRNEIFTVD